MSIRIIFHHFVSLLAVGCFVSAFAGEPPDTTTTGSANPGWDCWISTDLKEVSLSYAIRCIRSRESMPSDPPPDSLQALLLDIVHDNIHHGKSIEIDIDMAAGLLAEVSGYIKKIRIHQYPYPESWEQDRPNLLVRSALCRSNPECPVLVSR